MLKRAWSWFFGDRPAEVTVPRHLVEELYHLHKHCLLSLNSKPVDEFESLRSIVEKQWPADAKPPIINTEKIEVKSDKIPSSGLKNGGALCYCNSIIQLWFSNPSFRQALYNWQPKDEVNMTPVIMNRDYIPNAHCAIANLQILMAQMEFGHSRILSPESFAKSLNLSLFVQQDPEEFFSLFLSQEDDFVREKLACELYKIESTSIVKCTCGQVTRSEYPMISMKLPVTVEKQTVHEIVQVILAEEHLEDYNCKKCGDELACATKKMQLTSLPPTLILHVLRYDWDERLMQVIKRDTVLEVDRQLDFSPHFQDAAAHNVHTMYNLSGVIVHRGESANSGHYIAHLKDPKTAEWFSYSDDSIEKMKITSLMQEPLPPNVSKDNPEAFLSDCAYILIYDSINKKDVTPTLPTGLKEVIEVKNAELQLHNQKVQSEKASTIAQWMSNKAFLTNMILASEEGDDKEFVPLQFLCELVKNPQTNAIIDNEAYLCRHNQLDPSKVTNMRLIGSNAADTLFEKYKGGPRMKKPDCFCPPCAKAIIDMKEYKKALEKDAEIVARELFVSQSRPLAQKSQTFYISSFIMKRWCLIAELAKKSEYMTSSAPGQSKSRRMDGQMSTIVLNQDIMCVHGQLVNDANRRQILPDSVWKIIGKHFPSKITIPAGTARPCEQCPGGPIDANILLALATNLSNMVPELLHCSNEISLEGPMFFIPDDFVLSLQKFVCNPLGEQMPAFDIHNYLCEHNQLAIPLRLHKKQIQDDTLEPAPSSNICSALVIPQRGWLAIQKTVDTVGEIGVTGKPGALVTKPVQCLPCTKKKTQTQLLVHWDLSYIQPDTRLRTWREISPFFNDLEYFEVHMDLDDTLGQLKDKVADRVLAFLADDVHLYHKNYELEGYCKTLRELGLRPNSVIDCYVSPETDGLESSLFGSGAGFAGTSLGRDRK